MTKNNTLVDIPYELDLKDYTLSNKCKTKYKLQSVGLHFGNIYGGHYSSLVRKDKNKDDEWLLIDDLTINTIKKKDINFNFAYMLFYSNSE
jgi:ubiquitin C-terminal hydrolase